MLGEGLLNTVGLGMIYTIIVLIVLLFFLVEILKRIDRLKVGKPRAKKHSEASKVVTRKIKVKKVVKKKT